MALQANSKHHLICFLLHSGAFSSGYIFPLAKVGACTVMRDSLGRGGAGLRWMGRTPAQVDGRTPAQVDGAHAGGDSGAAGGHIMPRARDRVSPA